MHTHEHLRHLDDATVKALNAAGNVAESLEREDLESEITQLNVLDTPLSDMLSQNAITARAYEHEFVVVTNRMDKIGYATFRDGQIPRTVEISTVRRRIRPMLIGHRITVTELATRTTENGIQQIDELAKQEKMIAVANEFEYMVIYGDARLGGDVPGSPNNLQQDGVINIIKQGAPQNVLDLKGQPLTIDALWQAESRVVSSQSLARPTDVFISYMDKLNLQASFYQIARTQTAGERRAGLLGADAQSYIGVRGEHTLYPNQFLGDFHKFSPYRFGSEVGSEAAPPESWAAAAPTLAGTDSALADGVYKYAFKVANFYGESGAKFVTTAALTAGQKVTVELTQLSNVKWVDVYRQDPGSDAYLFYKRVPVSGSSHTFVDDGYETIQHAYGTYRWVKVPGTGVAFGLDRTVTTMAKWIGMEMYRLPPALTRDWVIWKVSSVFSRAPEFNWICVNIGQEPLV